MKTLKLTLLIICLVATHVVTAQSNPTVEVVLAPSTAQQGDTVTADIYVRNAVNIAGADIGITTDDQCLKIVDRQQGAFLPGTDSGGFSPLNELTDHETRLAVAITDRNKIANGDGIFFTTHLLVTCERGTGMVNVSFGQLSGDKDPTIQKVEIVSYSIKSSTLNTVNAQLAIGPAGQVTPIPTQPLPTSIAPIQPTSVAPVTSPTEAQSPLIPAIIIIVLVTIVIFAALIVVSRRRNNE